MAQDSHIIPLAPSSAYPKSDQDLNLSESMSYYNNHNNKNQKSGKYFVYFLSTIVILSIIMLIFSMIFFRFKSPSFELDYINVQNLRFSNSTNSSSFSMNMGGEIIVDNDNFGQINYQDSSMSFFLYDSVTIGIANVNVGRVEARKSKRIGISLQLTTNQLNYSYGNLSSDINSRIVKLKSFGEFRGKVKAMKIISKHKISTMNCTMNLNFTSQSIQDLLCS
ncbi:hypothetical protein EJD97_012165 [Solanum chilense]|uniref:Late embryogenesis abundant protein LEA-2 subgroup domain-containing protein n=1 Tax=Solanum chilense TaxID=4083 RepID=A0A6N2BE87_SOLCI|nr:hypothetical protein EJD97_012165 [Solanum chilense]